MAATGEQRRLLDLLNVCGLLADVTGDLRCVITRIANRAKTADEADDLRILIGVRGEVERARAAVARLHPDGRARIASDRSDEADGSRS